MKLIAALGNPTDKYKNTRHNAGFMVVDFLAQKWGFNFLMESKFKCEISKTIFKDEPIMVIKPMTFMNLSGESVALVMNFFKIPIEDLFVVYDDIALDLGTVRFRSSGSDGGHNGIKSIIKCIGTSKFDRLKVGIGPQPVNIPSEVFVLNNFAQDEKTVLEESISKSAEAIEAYLKEGLQIAQNKFN